MTRVLMVLDALLIGGTETHVLSAAEALNKRGHHVVIAAGDGPLRSAVKQRGCVFYPIHAPFSMSSGKRRAIREQLRKIIQREAIEVVHVHQGPSGLLAGRVAREYAIPVVFTVHGMIYANEDLEKISRLSQAVVSVSPPLHATLTQANMDSVLIPNGIDTVLYHPRRHKRTMRQRLGIPPEARVVLYAGRLSWEKALICRKVIAAGRHLRRRDRRVHLVIAGSGVESKSIRALAKRTERQLGARFIHCVGNRLDMEEMYAIADCVVGTGRVALEAMASARPVLCVGTSGYYGLLTPHNMEEAWAYYYGDHKANHPWRAKYMIRDLKRILYNKTKARTYGIAGREYVKGHFRIDAIAHQLEQLYEGLK